MSTLDQERAKRRVIRNSKFAALYTSAALGFGGLGLWSYNASQGQESTTVSINDTSEGGFHSVATTSTSSEGKLLKIGSGVFAAVAAAFAIAAARRGKKAWDAHYNGEVPYRKITSSAGFVPPERNNE